MIRSIRVLLFCAVLAYLVYLLASVLSFLVFDYHHFATFFRNHYPSAYRIDEYGETYFSHQHYEFVVRFAVLFALVLIAIIFLVIGKRRAITGWLGELIIDVATIKDLIVHATMDLTKNEKLGLITCFVSLAAIKTYFFFELPFHVDETFNFVYFVDQGIFHSSVFANNHPLTNIIASVWWKMNLSPELSFRLTSILSSFAVHILVYSVTTRFFNFRTGIFVLMLSGVTFWGNVYAVEGVAYMLMSLWVFLAFIALLLMNDDSNRGRPLFIASSVFGFYTTQLFIIPFVALVILWLSITWYNKMPRRNLRGVVASVITVAAGALLLYFPMYLWSGFDATFHSNTPRYDLIYMSPELFEGFSVMTDVNSKSYLVVLGLIVVTAFYFRRADARIKYLLAMSLATILSILIFSLIVGLYPPSRALVFANILFYVMTGVFVADLVFGRLSDRATVALCVVFVLKIAAGVYLFNFGWQRMPMGLQDKRSYQSVIDLSAKILSHKPKVIFSDLRDTHLNFALAFIAIKNDQHIEFTYDPARLAEADIVIINNQPIDESHYQLLSGGDPGRVLIRNNQ